MGDSRSKLVADTPKSNEHPTIISHTSSKEEKKSELTAIDGRPVFKGVPEDAILLFYSNFSYDLLKLIVSYWEFDLYEEKRVVLSSRVHIKPGLRWRFLDKDPLPAKAADYLIWGDSEKLEATINDYPYVLLVDTEATDHINTVKGTLYEIVLQINDILIMDDKCRTMTEMIESYLKYYFGEQEVEKQKGRACPILKQQEGKNLANRAEDKRALQVVWQALAASTAEDADTLAKDKDLLKAFAAYERQLSTQGDWMILVDAEQLYKREFYNLGGYKSFKINFYEDRILGTIELRRWRAWELQVLDTSVNRFCEYKYQIVVPRIDIRPYVDLNSNHRLGRHFSVSIFGRNPIMFGGRRPDSTLRPSYTSSEFEKFFQAKTSCLAEIISGPSRLKKNICRERIVRISATAIAAR